jgi:hypothetical protein
MLQEDVKNELLALDTHGTGQIDFEAFCSVVAAVLTGKYLKIYTLFQSHSILYSKMKVILSNFIINE